MRSAAKVGLTIDQLILTVPNSPRYFGVVRLLVGGVAARLDLPYEQLDDLQLAVESVLRRNSHPGGDVTLELEVDASTRTVRMRIGPLTAAALDDEVLEGEALSLRRLLSSLVDRLELVEQDGDDWLGLEKGVPLAKRSSA